MVIRFCPLCHNLMFVQVGPHGFLQIACRICPITQDITKTLFGQRLYPKLKEVDDFILTKENAWKNVDSTEERCPKCGHERAYFLQLQTRSADEPMTIFYRCCNHECSHTWKD